MDDVLLIDLTAGVDMDVALSKAEALCASLNEINQQIGGTFDQVGTKLGSAGNFNASIATALDQRLSAVEAQGQRIAQAAAPGPSYSERARVNVMRRNARSKNADANKVTDAKVEIDKAKADAVALKGQMDAQLIQAKVDAAQIRIDAEKETARLRQVAIQAKTDADRLAADAKLDTHNQMTAVKLAAAKQKAIDDAALAQEKIDAANAKAASIQVAAQSKLDAANQKLAADAQKAQDAHDLADLRKQLAQLKIDQANARASNKASGQQDDEDAPMAKALLDMVMTSRIGFGRSAVLVNRMFRAGKALTKGMSKNASVTARSRTLPQGIVRPTAAKPMAGAPPVAPPPVPGGVTPPPVLPPPSVLAALEPFILPVVVVAAAVVIFGAAIKAATDAALKARDQYFAIGGGGDIGRASGIGAAAGPGASSMAKATYFNPFAAAYGINPVGGPLGDLNDAKRIEQIGRAIRGSADREDAKRTSLALTGSTESAKLYDLNKAVYDNIRGFQISTQVQQDAANTVQNLTNVWDAITSGFTEAFAPVFELMGGMAADFDSVKTVTKALTEVIFGSVIATAKYIQGIMFAYKNIELFAYRIQRVIAEFTKQGHDALDVKIIQLEGELRNWGKNQDRKQKEAADRMVDEQVQTNMILKDINRNLRGEHGPGAQRAVPKGANGYVAMHQSDKMIQYAMGVA